MSSRMQKAFSTSFCLSDEAWHLKRCYVWPDVVLNEKRKKKQKKNQPCASWVLSCDREASGQEIALKNVTKKKTFKNIYSY